MVIGPPECGTASHVAFAGRRERREEEKVIRSRRWSVIGFALGAWLVAGAAGAQEQAGFASSAFAPSERGSRWFALDSLQIQGNGRLALGLVTDYSYRSVYHYAPEGDVAASIVRNQVTSNLGASIVIADRFRVGATVPLQLFADGRTAVINGVTHRPAEDVAVGDVRLALDARVLGAPGDAAVLAVGSELMLPSGSASAYTGDGKPRALPRLLFAGELGMFAYAARVGFLIRERNEPWGDGHIGSGPVFGASAGAQLLDKKLLVGPEIYGSTVTARDRAFDKRTTPIEALLGAHYDLGENLRVGAASGVGVTRGYGTPVFRAIVSLEWVPGDAKEAPTKSASKDRDGDGVPDDVDACGFVSGKPSDDPAKNGCPEADTDRDGVPDDVDACPTAAGAASSDPAKNGCPADRDGDGIVDAEDACASEPGKRTTDPKTNGCPVRDADGDGVPDDVDACINVAGLKTTDPKTNGCPDTDRDKDGVPNDADACPDAAGPANADPKKNGCPVAALVGDAIKITSQVKFATNKADIVGKESDEVLNAVATILRDHPEIASVRVEGHTDDRGNAAANKALSQARAESVVTWLAAHGIQKTRLKAQGFGSEKPLESNATETGRTNNRRVEFHVEEAKGSAR